MEGNNEEKRYFTPSDVESTSDCHIPSFESHFLKAIVESVWGDF